MKMRQILHLSISVLGLGVGIIACCSCPSDLATAVAQVAEHHPQVTRLTAARYARMQPAEHLLVDVRSPEEWTVCHLSRAWRCVPSQVDRGIRCE